MISGYKAVCFDMDGTLMNTHVDYRKMADLVFNEMVRVGVPESTIDRTKGSKFNLDSGVRWMVMNDRQNELYDIEKRISKDARDIEMENAEMARPYPGAMDLLKKLRAHGYKTGVLTRGCREYAEFILNMCNVTELLDALVCRDDFPESDAKPSPKAMHHLADKLNLKPSEILYVGDHEMDMRCAAGAGAGFIGVLTCGSTKKDWGALGAESVNTVSDISSML